MAAVNLKELAGNGGGATRALLPNDNYDMEIVDAQIRENTLNEPRKDGTRDLNLSITWEVCKLSKEQEEAAEEADEEWIGVRVWQDISLYYGDVKAGGPSRCKAFIDGLRDQGYLADFDQEAFDPESLKGIKQRVSIIRDTVKRGANAGKPKNKVAAVAPLPKRRAKVTPPPSDDDDAIPF